MYTISSKITTRPVDVQAYVIRTAIKTLHDPDADKEMIMAAKSLLAEFFPTHGQWMVSRNEYYGIPEMKMDRLDPEEMQQEVYLAMVENLPRISDEVLEKDDESVVRMTKSYISKFMDAAAKRYVEKKNHISKYYATCVLHMWKYHSHMTIQGHTKEEIAGAVRDVYPNRPMTGYATAAYLIGWSDRQLKEQVVSTSRTDVGYEIEYDEAGKALRLRRNIRSILTAEERKVFDLMEEGKTEKEIKQILGQQGVEISVSKAIRTIRTAAIACMNEQQIAAHKKAQAFTRYMHKKEYRRLSAAAKALS